MLDHNFISATKITLKIFKIGILIAKYTAKMLIFR